MTEKNTPFESIQACLSPDNPLIVYVKVKTSVLGAIYVRYGNKKAGVFQSAVTPFCSKSHEIALVRLRADTVYCYRVYLVTNANKIKASKQNKFRTGSLPFSLRNSFRFEMKGSFSRAAGVIILCCNGVTVTTHFFQGYIGIDHAGEIVWYYQDERTPVAGDFFQLANLNMIITRGQSLGLPVSEAHIFRAAQMQIINALGEIQYTQPLICNVFPDKIGQKDQTIGEWGFTHAAWPSPTQPNLIYNLGLELRDPFFNAGIAPAGTKMQLGASIRTWSPALGEQKVITTTFRLENPLTYRGSFSDDSVGVPVNCDGKQPGLPGVQDWVHGNAISRLNDSSPWVLSQRNTSSILVLDKSANRVLYKFGQTQPSDLKIPLDAQFVGQHDAHFLSSTRMLLFDDATDTGRSARGLEIELDLRSKSVRKIWEFVPKVPLYCDDGGSARRLANGNTILCFGASNLTSKHVFEACRSSNASRAELVMSPQDSNNTWLLYRAIPICSLFGEHRV